MPRPPNPPGSRTIPVSCRLKESGVAEVDRIAAGNFDGVRTRAVARLLALGVAAWHRGAR